MFGPTKRKPRLDQRTGTGVHEPKHENSRARPKEREQPHTDRQAGTTCTDKRAGTTMHEQTHRNNCPQTKQAAIMPVSENRIRLDSVFPSLSPEKHYICVVNDKPHINMEHNIHIPLLLTLGAGRATGIGSAIAYFARRTNKRSEELRVGIEGRSR